MVYYLGYKCMGKFIPIKSLSKDKNIDMTDIFSLIKFTNSFIDTKSLNEYLLKKQFISSDINRFYYLVQNSDNEYIPILQDRIFFSNDLGFFNLDSIKTKTASLINNQEFFELLLEYYLNKSNYVMKIKNIVYKLVNNPSYLKKVLIMYNTQIQNKKITELIEQLDFRYSEKDIRKVVDTFLEIALSNKHNYIILFELLYHNVGFILNETISCLLKVKEVIDTSFDDEEFYVAINGFIDSVAYINLDTNQKRCKIQKMNIAELGLFIYNYIEYLNEVKKIKEQSYMLGEIEYEEFLESDDFKGMDGTPFEYGLVIHMEQDYAGFN